METFCQKHVWEELLILPWFPEKKPMHNTSQTNKSPLRISGWKMISCPFLGVAKISGAKWLFCRVRVPGTNTGYRTDLQKKYKLNSSWIGPYLSKHVELKMKSWKNNFIIRSYVPRLLVLKIHIGLGPWRVGTIEFLKFSMLSTIIWTLVTGNHHSCLICSPQGVNSLGCIIE